MSPRKTFEQGTTLESVRDIYRRINDYASVTATFTSANTATSVTHALGRPPVGYQVLRVDKPSSFYNTASTLGDRTKITLLCDNSNVVATLRVF